MNPTRQFDGTVRSYASSKCWYETDVLLLLCTFEVEQLKQISKTFAWTLWWLWESMMPGWRIWWMIMILLWQSCVKQVPIILYIAELCNNQKCPQQFKEWFYKQQLPIYSRFTYAHEHSNGFQLGAGQSK